VSGRTGDALVELLTDRLASPSSTPASSAANLAAGIRAIGYWSFDPRLEVVVATSDRAPRDGAARSAWAARLGRRPVPLVLMIVTEDATEPAVVVGPGGDPPPVVRLDPRLVVDDLAVAAQLDPLEVRRRLPAAWERALGASGLVGLRNHGLFSNHYLQLRVPRYAEWDDLRETGRSARAVSGLTGQLDALGFSVEAKGESVYLLRAGGKPAAAVLAFPRGRDLDRVSSAGELPVALLLREMDAAGAAWGILATGGVWRLHSAADPSRATSFAEIDLDKLAEPGYFAALFSARALEADGLARRIAEGSGDFAVGLGDRLRSRIYQEVVPGIAHALDEALTVSGERPETRGELADLYAVSLRLLFRLLFVLYAEAREYLPVSASPGYRAHSLRTRLDGIVQTVQQDHSFDPAATDVWTDLQETFHAVSEGQVEWGVPPYDGGLFRDDEETSFGRMLTLARPTNAGLGPALYRLAVDTDHPDSSGRIDYSDLDIRRLGDIYEGLLQFELDRATEDLVYDTAADSYRIAADGESADVRTGQVYVRTRSGGRKASGSFYTPQFIVRHVVNEALVPALERHLAEVTKLAGAGGDDAAERLLWQFRVCDPAMGSGHFLVDALDVLTDRIATYLIEHPLAPVQSTVQAQRELVEEQARVLAPDALGQVRDVDVLKRVVLKRCIYGVDVNPMAVELARLALWLEAFVPGLPLSYLDHNLRHGNSLIGVVGDEVLEALEGWGKGNTTESMFGAQIRDAVAEARARAEQAVERVELRIADVQAAASAQREAEDAARPVAALYDAWTAEPFGASKIREQIAALRDSPDVITDAGALERRVGPASWSIVMRARDSQGFFHWPLAFPEVWGQSRPGFDVVLANPPWEKLEPERHNYYALYRPGLKGVRDAAERDRIMAEMDVSGSPAAAAYDAAVEEYQARKRYFVSGGGNYTLGGRAHLDLFKAFAERFLRLSRQGGAVGCVLPRQLLAGAGSSALRRTYLEENSPTAIDVIENNRHWAFENVHAQFTIVLVALERRAPLPLREFPIAGPIRNPAELASAADSRIGWTLADLRAGSPTLDVPLIGDAEMGRVFRAMLRHPRFGDERPEGWRAVPVQELNGTSDRPGLFETQPFDGAWEVWKGATFDRYRPGIAQSHFWADPQLLLEKLQTKRLKSKSVWSGIASSVLADPATLPIHSARIAFRRTTRATDSRTMRACLIPPRTACLEEAPTFVWRDATPSTQIYVLGVLCSLPFDWAARRRVEQKFSFAILAGLPIPSHPAGESRIAALAARLSCLDDRYAEFATEVGVECGPLTLDQHLQMEAEIDALVAHAYGLSEADLAVVFRDFTERAVTPDYRRLVIELFRSDR
jgi:hypothetical protein